MSYKTFLVIFGVTASLGLNVSADLYCSSAKGNVSYGRQAEGPPGNVSTLPRPSQPQDLSPWFVNGQRVAPDAFTFDDSSRQTLETQRPARAGKETYTIKAMENSSGESIFLVCEETWGPLGFTTSVFSETETQVSPEFQCVVNQQGRALNEIEEFAVGTDIPIGDGDMAIANVLEALRGIQIDKETQSIEYYFDFKIFAGSTTVWVDDITNGAACKFRNLYTSGHQSRQ